MHCSERSALKGGIKLCAAQWLAEVVIHSDGETFLTITHHDVQ
jgi:hypothetical protein